MAVITDRYTETNTSVFFHKTGCVFHRSFAQRYYGLSIVSARQKAKKWHTHAQQDEIIHYLKSKNLIK
jgi:hypothetical protein